ncbi:MAG TPA: cysteine dioxygenase family protein [Pirellulaceae bacterium]|nr:cysteine dioxygenase family protein [Pirellulaceae bacterium]HMO91001.1 cysteine dioxygenase family protein [Pirellulaceae bacterium]HMP68116.1 cysteine dioxygenase family protein [Pirellulaceae bacterium]
MNLSQLFAELDRHDCPLSLDELQNILAQLDVTPADFADAWHFDDSTYCRNLIRKTKAYEALLLCFEAGQRTPIHDHRGSACGVRIIAGTAVETIFDRCEDGWLFATSSTALQCPGVVGSYDSDVHQLSNLQPAGGRLATLHIYSPPLGHVGNYCIEDNSVQLVEPRIRVSSLVDNLCV